MNLSIWDSCFGWNWPWYCSPFLVENTSLQRDCSWWTRFSCRCRLSNWCFSTCRWTWRFTLLYVWIHFWRGWDTRAESFSLQAFRGIRRAPDEYRCAVACKCCWSRKEWSSFKGTKCHRSAQDLSTLKSTTILNWNKYRSWKEATPGTFTSVFYALKLKPKTFCCLWRCPW